MNTAILTLALTSALLAPTWQSSYSLAHQHAVAQKKPLVVVFGSGPNGWTKVIRDEKPAPEISKLLADQYVYVYVDTTSPDGKKLAQNFDVSGNLGVVISDRAGSLQAFWHQGDLTNQNMLHYLQKYADPRMVVSRTETATTSRTSFYPGSYSQSQAPTRTISSANC